MNAGTGEPKVISLCSVGLVAVAIGVAVGVGVVGVVAVAVAVAVGIVRATVWNIRDRIRS